MNRLVMVVWPKRRMNHQDMRQRWLRRALLVDEMIKIFRELDIQYRTLPLDMNVRNMPAATSNKFPSNWTTCSGSERPWTKTCSCFLGPIDVVEKANYMVLAPFHGQLTWKWIKALSANSQIFVVLHILIERNKLCSQIKTRHWSVPNANFLQEIRRSNQKCFYRATYLK